MSITVGVIGGRGFVGGELLRLLAHHPACNVVWTTSESRPGERVDVAHPPLRGSTLRYIRAEDAEACDAVFVASGHGRTIAELSRLKFDPSVVIDLGADFRLQRDTMAEHYDWARPEEFSDPWELGLAELNRDNLARATRIAVPGCMATSSMLMLMPLVSLGMSGPFHVDARTGSSGAGTGATQNTHALRANVMRISAPLRHRHQAEISQALGTPVSMTVSALPQVRGIQTLCRLPLEGFDTKNIRKAFAEFAGREPFVRFIGGRGQFAYPDPKVLLGSNFCDLGVFFEDDHLLAVAAIDNMVKGAAGNAVQCLNIHFSLDEDSGLSFPGLHPL